MKGNHMELTDIAELHKWQTSDGKEHYSFEAAQFHANRLNLAEQAEAERDRYKNALNDLGYGLTDLPPQEALKQ